MGPCSAHQKADRRAHPKSNYELFNCNNLNIRYWSWNYRGCWPFTTGAAAPPEASTIGVFSSRQPLSSAGISTYLKPGPLVNQTDALPCVTTACFGKQTRHGINRSDGLPRSRSSCRQPPDSVELYRLVGLVRLQEPHPTISGVNSNTIEVHQTCPPIDPR